MRQIDELHLEYPFAGNRMLRDFLALEGVTVGRLHVATLMKRMAIEAIYRRPNMSKPTPGHKIYPCLLRKLPVTRPNQVWAMDPLANRLPLRSTGSAGNQLMKPCLVDSSCCPNATTGANRIASILNLKN